MPGILRALVYLLVASAAAVGVLTLAFKAGDGVTERFSSADRPAEFGTHVDETLAIVTAHRDVVGTMPLPDDVRAYHEDLTRSGSPVTRAAAAAYFRERRPQGEAPRSDPEATDGGVDGPGDYQEDGAGDPQGYRRPSGPPRAPTQPQREPQGRPAPAQDPRVGPPREQSEQQARPPAGADAISQIASELDAAMATLEGLGRRLRSLGAAGAPAEAGPPPAGPPPALGAAGGEVEGFYSPW